MIKYIANVKLRTLNLLFNKNPRAEFSPCGDFYYLLIAPSFSFSAAIFQVIVNYSDISSGTYLYVSTSPEYGSAANAADCEYALLTK